MTAFAFILGVVPLMIASGAGAGAQNVMGTAVFWGMLIATAAGVLLYPATSCSSNRSVAKAGRINLPSQDRAMAPTWTLRRLPPRRRLARGSTDMARRLLLPTLLVIGGCTLGPDYHRPDLSAPETFREIQTAEATSLADTAWWDLFNDPVLQDLVHVALTENHDLKIAAERVEEARARYGFSRSYLWPSITAGANAGQAEDERRQPHAHARGRSANQRTAIRSVTSSRVRGSVVGDRPVRPHPPHQRSGARVDARHRRSQARRGTDAGCRRRRRPTSSSATSIGGSRLRARTVDSRREYVQLARDRFEGGITPEIDSLQAQAELRRIESIAADLDAISRVEGEPASVLLGRNPGEILRGRPVAEQPLPQDVPAGLPSDLLERRPDIKEAEHSLAAATANIGAAKALLFPRIALTGSYGVASTDVDELFESESKSWNVIGNVLQPIFEGGRNRRRVEITESQQRQALYGYESTVLDAFRETNDALSLIARRESNGPRRQAAWKRSVRCWISPRRATAAASPRISRCWTRSARSSMPNSTKRSRSAAHLSALVGLYRALGGGWPEAPDS
jgi:multidrug efflux system outer membrane protein